MCDSQWSHVSQDHYGKLLGPRPPIITNGGSNGSFYEVFTTLFSGQTSNPEVFLSDGLSRLHPDHKLVSTQSNLFDLFGYAINASHNINVKRHAEMPDLSCAEFVPSAKRKHGPGTVKIEMRFAGLDVEFNGTTIIAYLATWQARSCVDVKHWFLFEPQDTPGTAYKLIQTISIYDIDLNEQLYVFDYPGGWKKDRGLWEAIQKATWDDVILDADMKKSLHEDISGFFGKEKLYQELGVPWKRGVILMGPPGCGKTISLKAVLHDLTQSKFDVAILYVKTFQVRWEADIPGIKEVFRKARECAPCLLILEDLDSLITDTNRSFFLNQVDGLEDNDGVMIVGTTNHFERLDGAIANRPSRFDRKYHFGLPNEMQRRKYIKYWQGRVSRRSDLKFSDSVIKSAVSSTDGFSFAYLQELFVAVLLRFAGDNKASFPDILDSEITVVRKQMEIEKKESEDSTIKMKRGDKTGEPDV